MPLLACCVFTTDSSLHLDRLRPLSRESYKSYSGPAIFPMCTTFPEPGVRCKSPIYWW